MSGVGTTTGVGVTGRVAGAVMGSIAAGAGFTGSGVAGIFGASMVGSVTIAGLVMMSSSSSSSSVTFLSMGNGASNFGSSSGSASIGVGAGRVGAGSSFSSRFLPSTVFISLIASTFSSNLPVYLPNGNFGTGCSGMSNVFAQASMICFIYEGMPSWSSPKLASCWIGNVPLSFSLSVFSTKPLVSRYMVWMLGSPPLRVLTVSTMCSASSILNEMVWSTPI